VAKAIREWWPLAAIVAFGAYLRLANLGALGFRWDEDLSGLAVRAILETGMPELPSGMLYLRGGIFSHLMAASAALFGFSEFSLRLPAALFGIALIPAGYVFAATLFGKRVALATAALIAISFWDIDIARYARFYSAFSVMYVLTLYAIWRFRVQTPSAAGGVLCIALAVFTLTLHDFAYSLALAFFYPLALRGPGAWRSPREWLWPVSAAGTLFVSFLVWRDYVLSARFVPAAEAAADAGAPGVEIDQSLIDLPDLPLLKGMLAELPWFVPLVALTAIGLALAAGRRFRSSHGEVAALALIAALAAVQLFNLALIGVLLLAFAKRTGLPALRSPEVIASIALIAVTFAAWLAAVLAAGIDINPLQPTTPRAIVRELLDYPYFYVFWGFPNEWPLAAAVASVGALVVFNWAAGPSNERSAAGRFALLALAGPIVSNAMFEGPFELFRYNAAFNTLFFVFVAVAFVHWGELVAAWRPQRQWHSLSRPAAAFGTAALVLLAVMYDLNPVRGLLAIEREYANDGTLYRTFGMTAYSDFKTTADYVAQHASPGDLIVTPDSREYYNYLGRVDLWLRSDRYAGQSYAQDGVLRDLYVGTRVVTTLEELKKALAKPNSTKWVLASSSVLERSQAAVAPEIRDFLLNAESHVVYVGRDRDRKVYRFE
jgi:hypothetical protein